ncbi:Multidrug resistance protein MdtA [Alteripontixanthobacter maritimus]|uniref:Multidrug resistance protein MdtA n=1 Tax=Alteripontixanthobacter maritimus TaxID=2161824 RepID=A0A369Q9D2_9SPHN|nr:efflux RND transporter periplasmic adaptor subunit [Alteripontixanthobacter maritimus]RDC61092.1 Multidrug resistance protein MdtA [Alteripontixanthobacter maritimus]
MNYESPLEPHDEPGNSRNPARQGLDAVPMRDADGVLQDDRVGGPRKRRTGMIVLIAIGLALAALAAFLILRGGEATEETAAQLPLVTVSAPGAGTVEGMIETTGTLSARRELPVGIAGEGGRVVSVPVDAGDWVSQGQVLAVIDRSVQNQQVASAAAQIDVAQADANLAQANLDRALKLVDRGFISKADVDQLRATRDAAVARVRVARAQVAELRARNARLNVYAPAAGLVLERSVEPGQIVSAGSGALFRIARGGEMELMADLGEADLARISTGATAQVTPVGSDTIFEGQIWQVAPTIDATNRQGTARISLPYSPELRPGGFATATISSGTVVAPLLPESAIQADAKGSYVYIVGSDNKVARRDIETGNVTADGITVASGLTGRERVVMSAAGFLSPGQEVKPETLKK